MPGSPRCLIVTRPQPQADAWVAQLAAHHTPAIALPLLQVVDDPAFAADVQAAWQRIAAYRLVMFVSPNAVLRFFAQRPADIAWPAATLAGATGPGTTAALQQAGVSDAAVRAPSPTAERFDAEALWSHALQSLPWSGASVLVVRGASGRDWLGRQLQQAGAQVQFLSAYRQAAPAWDASTEVSLAAIAAAPHHHAWLFSSSSAIEHLSHHASHTTAWPALASVAALATHPRIADTARRAGFAPVIATRPDVAAVADAAASLRQHRGLQGAGR